MKTENNWKALVTSEGGAVSLLKNLTHAEAVAIREKLLRFPNNQQNREQYEKDIERYHPFVEKVPETKEEWDKFCVEHPFAKGLHTFGYSVDWEGTPILDSDIKSVEIFQ